MKGARDVVKTVKFNRTSTVGDGVIIYAGVTIGNHCEIGDGVTIAQDTLIRSFSIICDGAVIGARCKIGPHVLIQPGVIIGDDCAIHSHSFLCEGVTLADGVFVGHNVTTCNEKHPKTVRDEPWKLKDRDRIFVDEGAVIGSGAVILPGVRIGKNAKIGAGAIVVYSVPSGVTMISPKAVSVEERYGYWGKFL